MSLIKFQILLFFALYFSAKGEKENPCASHPCYNGGTCYASGDVYTCTCKPDYTGDRCEFLLKCHPGDIDLFYVLDSSGSIGAENFKKALRFLASLTSRINIAKNSSQIGLIRFNDKAYLSFWLNQYRSKELIIKNILATPYIEGHTNIARGMMAAIEQGFVPEKGDRDGYPDVMLVITDGRDKSDVRGAHRAAVAKNISIIAIGIGDKIDYHELLEVTGDEKKIFYVETFTNITAITGRVCKKIQDIHPCGSHPCQHGGTCIEEGEDHHCICPQPFYGTDCEHFDPCPSHPCQHGGTCLKVADDKYHCFCPEGYTGKNCEKPIVPDPCLSNPCQHGGTCVPCCDDEYDCLCPPHYTGKNCQKPVEECHSLVDLFLVVDSSGSMGAENFYRQKIFLRQLLHQMSFGSTGARVSVTEFEPIKKLFHLNTFTDLASLDKAIANMPYESKGTNIAEAMLAALSDVEGDRATVSNVLLLLTDGQDGSDVTTAYNTIQKKAKTKVLAIGVGSAVDRGQLVAATGGLPSRVKLVAEFKDLKTVLEWTCKQFL